LLVLKGSRQLGMGQKLFNLVDVWAIGAHGRDLD
jgi:hypothetical protein